MRRHDPGEGGGQLRPHRDCAIAFIGKIEKLRDDLGAALFRVKIGRFENRAIPFNKAIAATDLAPPGKNRVPESAVVRQEISETGQWLHRQAKGKGKADLNTRESIL